MKRSFRWALLTLVVLVLGYLGISVFVASRLTASVHQPMERTPEDAGLDYSEVGFESSDRLNLKGWSVPGGDSFKTLRSVTILGDPSEGEAPVTGPPPVEKPLPTIWRVPDELWERIEPILKEHEIRPRGPAVLGRRDDASWTPSSSGFAPAASETACPKSFPTTRACTGSSSGGWSWGSWTVSGRR